MRAIEQTLAEQMQISEREVEQRKHLLNFTEADALLLARHKNFIASHIEQVVDDFYSAQVKIPEIALLIGDAETLRLLRNAMRRYILELFDGHYDGDYVNRRLRIGKVHKRIGVAPKLYISAIWLLQQTLNQTIATHIHAAGDQDCANQLQSALNKLMTLDTGFVFDTYIASLVSEVDAAKQEMANYASSLEEVVAQRTRELQELSRRDNLTQLYNQRAFYEIFRLELASAARYRDAMSLVYLDLNHFKQLNDQQGHLTGDELLTRVGHVLLEHVRETDFACRYGGDEFTIIMPRTNAASAEQVCRRLAQAPLNFDSGDIPISLSIGYVTTGPDEFDDIDTLIKKADQAMYVAKEAAHQHGGSHIAQHGNTAFQA